MIASSAATPSSTFTGLPPASGRRHDALVPFASPSRLKANRAHRATHRRNCRTRGDLNRLPAVGRHLPDASLVVEDREINPATIAREARIPAIGSFPSGTRLAACRGHDIGIGHPYLPVASAVGEKGDASAVGRGTWSELAARRRDGRHRASLGARRADIDPPQCAAKIRTRPRGRWAATRPRKVRGRQPCVISRQAVTVTAAQRRVASRRTAIVTALFDRSS